MAGGVGRPNATGERAAELLCENVPVSACHQSELEGLAGTQVWSVWVCVMMGVLERVMLPLKHCNRMQVRGDCEGSREVPVR